MTFISIHTLLWWTFLSIRTLLWGTFLSIRTLLWGTFCNVLLAYTRPLEGWVDYIPLTWIQVYYMSLSSSLINTDCLTPKLGRKTTRVYMPRWKGGCIDGTANLYHFYGLYATMKRWVYRLIATYSGSNESICHNEKVGV